MESKSLKISISDDEISMQQIYDLQKYHTSLEFNPFMCRSRTYTP